MKTIKFYKDGTNISIFDYDDEQVIDKLPPAIYTLCRSKTGYYLSFVSKKFEVPNKIYGSTINRVEKILTTYDDRDRSTGVLMTGDKGSGKTMLSSILCNKMIERGLPVILIEKPFDGTIFIDFLNNIGESVLFFDEFGKVFSSVEDEDEDNNSQTGLLSVFDGTHTIKRLILLTENEQYKINRYMINRPGRIYYHFKYSKLEESLVREYCNANDIPEDVIDSILLRIESSKEFSFDVLKAVVEEYKRFGEDIEEVFSNLNIEQPEEKNKKSKVIGVYDATTGDEYEVITKTIKTPGSGLKSCVKFKDIAKNDISEKDKDMIKRMANSKVKDYEYDKRIVYIGIKDLVERTSEKAIYKNSEENVFVVIEKNTENNGQIDMSDIYSKYLD